MTDVGLEQSRTRFSHVFAIRLTNAFGRGVCCLFVGCQDASRIVTVNVNLFTGHTALRPFIIHVFLPIVFMGVILRFTAASLNK